MNIIVLAGGADQIALIQELKIREQDINIILVDYFDNPPAKKYANKHIKASTLDIDEVKQIAINEKADLITTACTDQAMLTMAKVSEDLSLPCYISYQKALNVTNKSYMKEMFIKNKIPTAKYSIVSEYDCIDIPNFEYPLVVKPVDCNSSKGVKKVYSKSELDEALTNAIAFSRTNSAIIEEFKEGIELSVDVYIDHGVAKILSITSSNKIPNNNNSFTILQSCYPASINLDIKIKIQHTAQLISEKFELDNCPMLIQLICDEENIFVLEFSARMGGGSKYNLIQILSGVDIMKVYTDRVLGLYPTVNPSELKKHVKMNYVYCKPGIISEFNHFNTLQNNGLIHSYFLYKSIGMEIVKSETSSDRPAGFVVVGDTQNELDEKINIIDSTLNITDINNKDIMIHGLFA